VGRFYDRSGAKLMLIVGFAALTVAMFFLSRLSITTSLIMLIALHVCVFLGISLIFTPVQANSLNQLPKEYTTDGVAILNTFQQIAAAFGSSLFVGLVGTIELKSLENFNNPDILQRQAAIVSGVDTAFTAALVIVVIGLFFLFYKTSKNNS
jgi:DHA2 family lincomycin resistance protein-like MFS transporter